MQEGREVVLVVYAASPVILNLVCNGSGDHPVSMDGILVQFLK